MLTYADVCSMLTYADVCSMLTYADVCSMLTYADVCVRCRRARWSVCLQLDIPLTQHGCTCRSCPARWRCTQAAGTHFTCFTRYPTDTARLYVSLLPRPLALHAGRRYSLYLLYWCKSTNTDAAAQLRRGMFGGRASIDAPALA